ncbi:hypothetical protein INT48_003811 [Thamnidium elegans]|uniref:Uncharacterized protein n=1 Tax=Thamnidium elegans TaxID=101142 RepID=A0A8H7SVV7_9FUNG|nr:hypothetical protein INT48_003811 [Thamnidium elegans]
MVFISRNHALCIYYQLKFNQENVAKALEKFQPLSDEHEVCYLNDPTIPVLVSKPRLYGNSFVFKEYLTEEVSEEIVPYEFVVKLETKAEVLQFMNETYSVEPVNGDLYILKSISLSEIFTELLKHSTYFNNKTFNSFNSFCGKNDLKFLSSNEHSLKRVKNKDGIYERRWNLYVLNDKYKDNIVQDIVQYGDKFKEFIQGQKSNGFKIVGYARKSPGDKDKEKRARLLRTMIDKLRSRSLVDKVFVSQSSLANEPFKKRDINDDVFEGADGSTRDLLNFLNFSEMQVILVTLDYAGLSTNIEDLKEFLR